MFGIVFITGGGLQFVHLYITFGAIAAVQVFLTLILSVLARHANLICGLKIAFLCDLSCK